MKILVDIDLGGQILTKQKLEKLVKNALAKEHVSVLSCDPVEQAKVGFRSTLFTTDNTGKLETGNEGVRCYKTMKMAQKHATGTNIVELYALKVAKRGQ